MFTGTTEGALPVLGEVLVPGPGGYPTFFISLFGIIDISTVHLLTLPQLISHQSHSSFIVSSLYQNTGDLNRMARR